MVLHVTPALVEEVQPGPRRASHNSIGSQLTSYQALWDHCTMWATVQSSRSATHGRLLLVAVGGRKNLCFDFVVEILGWAQAWWCRTAIPAIQEAEAGG